MSDLQGQAPSPRSGSHDVGPLADMLETVSAELEATTQPDSTRVTGDGAEATENRTVRETQAHLARATAQALRGEVAEVRLHARGSTDDARRLRQGRRLRMPRPAASEVPLADLERLCRQALAVAEDVAWAEIAVPSADGSVVTASAGRMPPALVQALAAGPRAEALGHGYVVAVDDTAHDGRWPALGTDGVRSVLVLPLGVRGGMTLTAAAPGAFDDATRAVAREVAAHAAALLAGEGAGVTEAVRARQLVVTASTLLARRRDLDPSDGLDALLERAATAGSTVLAAAEQVLEELGLPGDGGRPQAPEPATLRRALAHLEEHAAEDVDVADVARAAGLGVRGLQMTFRRWRGTTPLGHLREIRLARAHEELRAADARDTTVADIATRWHFTHPGRFSVTYRERYGCSPSATLRA